MMLKKRSNISKCQERLEAISVSDRKTAYSARSVSPKSAAVWQGFVWPNNLYRSCLQNSFYKIRDLLIAKLGRSLT